MLHALWASDCYKPWTVRDTKTTTSRWTDASFVCCMLGLDENHCPTHIEPLVWTCILMSAHPLQSSACACLQLFVAVQRLKDPLTTFKSAFSICVWVVWVVCWSWLNSHFFANWRHPFCRRCVWSFALWICAREHDISMRAVNLIRWSFVRWSSSSISGGHVLYAPPGRRL